MFTIKGQFNTALCYAKAAEESAIEQVRRMCDCTLSEGCRICIMPDVHSGKGCTIGTTMTITDKVCPNLVGVDIGCGMYTVELGRNDIDFEKADKAAHFIPSGMRVWEKQIESFDLTELKCCRELHDTRRLECSLGTLGGGNHFIEIDRSGDGRYYLIIHSGSRNLGKQAAEYYQSLAVSLNKGRDKYYKMRDEIIRVHKAEGRQSEIQRALSELDRSFEGRETTVPEDLCWLYGEYMDDYLADIQVIQRFARRNRELIAENIMKLSGLTPVGSFHTIHNYIDTGEMILRKGAIAAHRGERVLIPINMRDGSVIAVGKGNKEWNFSAPHGAGRVMSRTEAKKNILLEEYRSAMEGIYSTCVNEFTLDEAPMAYKSIDAIIDVIGETVDIEEIIKPVYNFKANDEDVPWRKKK